MPVAPNWIVAVTGGFAEVNKTFTYNCVTFCAVAPASPAFSASQDVWLAGAYLGGGLQTRIALPGLPNALIGFDYKHIFLGDQTVTLGSATRLVTLSASQDIDLFLVGLTIPLR